MQGGGVRKEKSPDCLCRFRWLGGVVPVEKVAGVVFVFAGNQTIMQPQASRAAASPSSADVVAARTGNVILGVSRATQNAICWKTRCALS